MSRQPFVKRHKRYPLTKFADWLARHHAIANGAHYLAALRKLFVAVEANGEPQWRSFSLVLAHYQTLSRRDQNWLRAAWTHFLRYAGEDGKIPRLGTGVARVGPLAEALRRLVNTFQSAGLLSKYNAVDLVSFTWGQNGRAVFDADGQRVPWFDPALVPVLRLVREWAYAPPYAPSDGAWFLPSLPGNSVPMHEFRLRNTLDNKTDLATAHMLELASNVAVYAAATSKADVEVETERLLNLLDDVDRTAEEVAEVNKLRGWLDAHSSV